MSDKTTENSESSEVLQNYKKIEKIGEGSYGVVYKGSENTTGRLVAIKKMRLFHEDEGIPGTAIREVSLLKGLHHPNIVDLMNVVSSDNNLYLIFEYLDHDLKAYMDTLQQPLSPMQVKSFVFQILLGLHFCHANRVLHRDLKPQNLLVCNGGKQIKISDFGLARSVNLPIRTLTHKVVTLWYRAPELLMGGKHYSTPVDIWSVGCIMAELVNKRPLFPGDSEIDELYKIFRTMGTPNETTWPGVSEYPHYMTTWPNWSKKDFKSLFSNLCPQGINLIQQMLTYDPSKRISAKEALNHPYFADLNKGAFL